MDVFSKHLGALAQLGAHHTGSVGVRGSSPLCSTKKVRNTFVFRTFLFFKEHGGLEGRAPAGSIAVRQNFGGRNSVSRDGKCCVIGFVTPPAGGQVLCSVQFRPSLMSVAASQ